MDYNSHDLAQVQRFYTETLGFSRFSRDADSGYLWIVTGETSSLGFTAPTPGPPEQWRPPREPSIYLFVADVDRAHRDLAAKDLTFESSPTDMPWGHRIATLRDPEGRLVVLAQRTRP
jgi:catechol 2,3-dioxygenase-like lactoylglutathione lyase family enzyme